MQRPQEPAQGGAVADAIGIRGRRFGRLASGQVRRAGPWPRELRPGFAPEGRHRDRQRQVGGQYRQHLGLTQEAGNHHLAAREAEHPARADQPHGAVPALAKRLDRGSVQLRKPLSDQPPRQRRVDHDLRTPLRHRITIATAVSYAHERAGDTGSIGHGRRGRGAAPRHLRDDGVLDRGARRRAADGAAAEPRGRGALELPDRVDGVARRGRKRPDPRARGQPQPADGDRLRRVRRDADRRHAGARAR